ncbi:MAG: hypothetical protein HOP28_13305 [Gemmatimonadales bacterium]|nr:hypothetical protein [Gemmatimonadales bacterium]
MIGWNRRWIVMAVIGTAVAQASPAGAQIDYRNLDDDRPTLIEDAYPAERYAFEFQVPWRFSRDRSGGTLHAFVPELAYGIFRNMHVGLKMPIAGTSTGSGREWGGAGLRAFAFYNFNTESRSLPALALRSDVTFPVGSLAGEGTRVTIKGIATRSWGRTRVHLNGAYTLGSDRPLGAAEAANKWWYGGAVDRTLFRQSVLLLGEVYALRALTVEPVQVNASVGLRVQMTPYLVFDAGIARRLKAGAGPDLELTAGFSRAFAISALMPSGRTR